MTSATMETINITKQILKACHSAIRVAIEYEKLTKRKLGITGEIGEVLVCNHGQLKSLGLKLLSNPISAGFDAIDKKGMRYQIKATRNELGRLSKFAVHEFDFAILAIFSERYEIKELWKASYKMLKPQIARHQRRNPSVREFKNIAKKIQ